MGLNRETFLFYSGRLLFRALRSEGSVNVEKTLWMTRLLNRPGSCRFFWRRGGEKNISSTIICANCCFVWCVVFFFNVLNHTRSEEIHQQKKYLVVEIKEGNPLLKLKC